MMWSRELGCAHPGRLTKFCGKPLHAEGPMCKEHGCAKCGHVILADSEDGPELLCHDHWDEQQRRFSQQ